jgi:putative spermidine/putrescine transport system substrate-binding protein/spermidine/putrescine transport system substrate-binding protein
MLKPKFRIMVMLSVLITLVTILFSGVIILMPFAQSVTADEQVVLHVTGWDVYADPVNKNKTIGYKSFEDEYGVQIEFKPLINLDEIVDAAESHSEYDVFIISNEGIRLLHGMGLVMPMDLRQLPNYLSLHPHLRYTEWALFESRNYAVPFAWGPTGLLYDTDVLTVAPDSWNILWDPAYRGRVSMWDDVSMVWTAALALGYQNVYNLTREQLGRVKGKLYELNGLVHGYYNGEVQEQSFIINDNVIVLNSWFDPSSRLAATQKRNFKMVIPKEGAVGMFDSFLISKGSRKKTLAHKFINYQISPAVQKLMVRITGLAPANIETLALLTPEEIKSLHLDEPDYFNRMLLWDHMPRKHLYQDVLEDVRENLKLRPK